MALKPSNSSSFEQLALKGLKTYWCCLAATNAHVGTVVQFYSKALQSSLIAVRHATRTTLINEQFPVNTRQRPVAKNTLPVFWQPSRPTVPRQSSRHRLTARKTLSLPLSYQFVSFSDPQSTQAKTINSFTTTHEC